MRSILITGGSGFIGSHTCVCLLEKGYDVIVIDNLSNSKIEIVEAIERISGKKIKFYQGDVMDRSFLEKIFAHNSIDAVIHFAGLKAVKESIEKPLLYYFNNIASTLTLCQIMQTFGCKTIVFSSSAAVYGLENSSPMHEDMPVAAINPYGQSKLMQEQILKDLYAADPEWSIMLLRYFNPVGAHESGLIGESPAGIPNNLMPYICNVALGKAEYLNIFGNDYDTPDGTAIRDYIHVMDLAEGHVGALAYVFEHKGIEVVNLGTGQGTSVLEIVQAFEETSGQSIPRRFASRRAGDIPSCYADVQKAKKFLNWTAVRNIADMCRDSWRFSALQSGRSE